MAIRVKITNKERIYINGATGQRLTPEQFAAKHKRTPGLNMGAGRANQAGETGAGAAEQTKDQ